MSNVLIVDVGTQSMRGIVFDDSGNLLIKEQVKYKPYLCKENGYMEQSADMYWQGCCVRLPARLPKNVPTSCKTFWQCRWTLSETLRCFWTKTTKCFATAFCGATNVSPTHRKNFR